MLINVSFVTCHVQPQQQNHSRPSTLTKDREDHPSRKPTFKLRSGPGVSKQGLYERVVLDHKLPGHRRTLICTLRMSKEDFGT